MKRRFLQVLFWVAALDLVLGLVLLAYRMLARETVPLTRGGLVLLVVGAFGCFWFGSALRREALQVRT